MKPEGQKISGLYPYPQFERAKLGTRAKISPGRGTHDPDGRFDQFRKTEEEYVRVAELLADVPMPITYLPGNHDQRDNLLAGLSRVETDNNGYLQSAFEFDKARVLCIDTVFGPPYVSYAHFRGLLRQALCLAGKPTELRPKPQGSM